MYKRNLFILLLLFSSLSAQATEAVDQLLNEYRQAGASAFSVEAGKKVWEQSTLDAQSGKERQCANCHTADLRAEGKHMETGKLIKPLAPSVNSARLSNVKDIQKWLLRNCKWTMGRECTPQEKGDVLSYIQAQ
ncbi:DUF1924 domain-containing protein [Beggiatoa leptomitoformis]|uniref:DUF1924 domain-containing protein n=2 Tax=Beggiatoa leptomitoformis TaxID=288004 RepID=A0A2N9YE81_9GAMM|nr:DUF1924 domain-containing protein [Beggiatoa leptomitoformis]AUI68695.1 DUF1924 domain-containing protein [Beggiatoa leptomitoformis]